jgi:hypothetical protein
VITYLFGQTAPDGLPGDIANWSLVGVLASLLAFYLRRQGKLQDNAQIAAQEARAEVTAQYEKRLDDQRTEFLARLEALDKDRRETEHELLIQVGRQTRALRRVAQGLMDPNADQAARIRLRDDVLGVLFDRDHPDPGGAYPPVAPP